RRRRWCFRRRSDLGHHAGPKFSTDGAPYFRDVPPSSSFRAGRLEGEHRHCSVLDFVCRFRLARFGDAEVAMNPRYQNKNIAVLGAGLSGTAAALLLRSHDANVSVLDSATENKLPESTIKNLRDHGVRVISGPAAETNRDPCDLAVLSPGIDPDSPLAQIAVWLNFAPDHLDRYASVAEYHAAKLRIFEYQTEKEFAVVNASDYLPQIKAHRLTFSAYDDRADFRLADGTICFERTPVLR